MGGRRIIEEDVDSHGLLIFAAGAMAGAALGAYLARRYETVDALAGAVRAGLAEMRDAWLSAGERQAGELLEDEDEVVDEDDDETLDEYEDEIVDEDEDDVAEEDDVADEDDVAEEDDVADEDDERDASESAGPFYESAADTTRRGRREREVAPAGTAHAAGAPADAAPGKPVAGRPRRESRELELRVLTALRADDVLGRRAIEIAAVGDGVVELTGSVRTLDEAARAAAAAREVEGVQMVLNRLGVRAGGHVDTTSVPRGAAGRGGTARSSEPGAPEA